MLRSGIVIVSDILEEERPIGPRMNRGKELEPRSCFGTGLRKLGY